MHRALGVSLFRTYIYSVLVYEFIYFVEFLLIWFLVKAGRGVAA